MSKSTERGQALILIALAAVGLFAFAALAIDGSRQFSNKRNAQNAADTAVLTAALKHVRTNADLVAAQAAAEQIAEDNGYKTNWNDTIVDFDICNNVIDIIPGTSNPVAGDVQVDASGIPILDGSGQFMAQPCEGLPVGANAEEYIRVKIISSIPTTFGRVIGRQTLISAAEAIAHVQGSSSTSSAPGHAIMTLRTTDCGVCGDGNVTLTVKGSGIFSNSSAACAPPQHGSIDFNNGISTVTSDGGYTMAPGGGMCAMPAPWGNVTGTIQPGPQISSMPFSIPAPAISCTGNYDQSSATVDPLDGSLVYPAGNYSAQLVINTAGFHKFSGNYCFGSGVTVQGNANLIINNASFRLDGGSLDVGGGSGAGTLSCNNWMVYGAPGSTGLKFNGNGRVTCSGVTFYVETGSVKWNGNSNSYLKAPTSGPYKGLLMYLPETAESRTIHINGNSANEIVGSIIAPSSEVLISGVSGSAGYNTQIISQDIKFSGHSNTTINYDPSVLYSPPASPTIQLTK